MAIDATVLEYEKIASAGNAIAAPASPILAGANKTAAGNTTLNARTRAVTVRNNTAGDSILVGVHAASATQSGKTNAVQITAGNERTFYLPRRQSGTDYYLDIRAG